MTLNKEEIQKLLSELNSELDIFSLRNPNYDIVINPDQALEMICVVNNIRSFLEDLLKIEETKTLSNSELLKIQGFPEVVIPESLFSILDKHFLDEEENKNDVEKGLS